MRHTVSILVQNQPGVLVRVASMFSRRGFNIDSLAVGVTEDTDYSRITAVVPGSDAVVGQVVKQLAKLYEVRAVQVLPADSSVTRGLCLFKVDAPVEKRVEIIKLAEVFRARVADVSEKALIFEITGDDGKIAAFEEMMRPYGIIEMARTGVIGLVRGSDTIYNYREAIGEHGENLL
ncbi:MAG: acetolactate synthase small subunit [Negativicutes bacterium]|nr:acetolactate synthase small subunit [Negativicutes bacterium]